MPNDADRNAGDHRDLGADRDHRAVDHDQSACRRQRPELRLGAGHRDDRDSGRFDRWAHRRAPQGCGTHGVRARGSQSQAPQTVAHAPFVDIDHLKTTNDTLGHVAGDQLLSTTVETIRTHLGSYDLIIRYGGDEFVCALLDMTAAGAAERFALVSADLRAKQASITVGLAELEADDAPEDVLARADHALYAERQRLRSNGGLTERRAPAHLQPDHARFHGHAVIDGPAG